MIMARLSRSELKGIVKECLVEILQEGLDTKAFNAGDARLTESKKRSAGNERKTRRSTALDKIERGSQKDNKSIVDNAELAANSQQNSNE